jgi:hypothetical protein
LRWTLTALVVGLSAGDALSAGASATLPRADPIELLAAGSQRDLWVVVADADERRFRLLHRTPRARPDTLHTVNDSPGRPVAIAAAGRTVYLLFDDGGCQSVRFEWLSEMNRPNYTATQLPPLPDGVVAFDAAATDAGPVALVRERVDEQRIAGRLFALRDGVWGRVECPLDGPTERLEVIAGAGGQITIVGQTRRGSDPREGSDALTVATRVAGQWQTRQHPTRPNPVVDVIAVAGRPVVVTHDPASHEVELALLHADGRTLDAGRLPLVVSPKRRFAVTGRAGEALTVSRNIEGELSIAVRDLNQPPDAGAALRPLTVAPWPGEPLAHEMIAWGMLLIGIVLVVAVWRRNPAAREVKLPGRHAPRAADGARRRGADRRGRAGRGDLRGVRPGRPDRTLRALARRSARLVDGRARGDGDRAVRGADGGRRTADPPHAGQGDPALPRRRRRRRAGDAQGRADPQRPAGGRTAAAGVPAVHDPQPRRPTARGPVRTHGGGDRQARWAR